MNCEWCRESIALLDAQTSSGRAYWHTRCWNEVSEDQRQYFEEMDDLEGFTPRIAPPDEFRPALPDELGPKPEGSEVLNDMATAPQQRPQREVVDFPFNVPVTVALKYPQGKTVSTQYGERILMTLHDGRIMFLDPEVVGRIETMGINVRESFSITRSFAAEKGGPPTWEIARIAGEQANGTLVLVAPDTQAPRPPAATATLDAGIPRKQPGSALVSEANGLVDAFAEVLDRALTTYQGRVKPDEVRALLISAYIQRRQLSSVA